MQVRQVILILFAAMMLPMGLGRAQSPDDSRTLELVDRLKDVIQRAERNRVDGVTVNQLKDLVRRYDWPWRIKLLSEDFRDGDFTANPNWQVSRGEFRVVRGAGLITLVGADSLARPAPPERERSGGGSAIEGILGGILRGVLEPAPVSQGSQFRGALPMAEISTPVGIGNVFAVRVRLLARERNPENSRIEFGPYRGGERDWGYRLAYSAGSPPALEIVRLSPGRAAVVERFDGVTGLEDGRAHQVELRRDRDGAMQALVDGKEFIRTADKGLNDFFDGFTIVNGGGEYQFERIEIYGTER